MHREIFFVTFTFNKNVFLLKTSKINYFSIPIHGGAGTLEKGMMTAGLEANDKSVLKFALEAGYAVLEYDGTSIDAV